jgi:inorganic triphosphatase YgiF
MQDAKAKEVHMSEEFELTLRVCAQDPGHLFCAVAGLRSIGCYELVPAGASVVHDRYFDTDCGRLMHGRFALRLRQDRGRTLLGLKGKERIDARGAIRRLEIEGEWSEDMLAHVLHAAGLIPRRSPVFLPRDPVSTLSGLGLRVIQCRRMERTGMHVVDTRMQAEGTVGELALDAVRYQAAGTVFMHHEIEIEASSQGSEDMVADLAALLQKEFPGALCRWDHNKLITGLALQALAAQHPAGPSSPEGIVIPGQWYERIEDWIRRHRDFPGQAERHR